MTPPRPIHLICNAHIDPVWLWEWQEGAACALSTFRTAADLCEEFPGFIFNHNEALLYGWIKEYEPSLFERIQKLVRAGRWHVMGGWHLQPDCNMPSGESLIRQILVGRRFFTEHFGVEPRTAINFDSFGHSRGLVQILARCGFDSYIFTRPSGGPGNPEEPVFTWIGFDGSRITALRCPSYGTPMGKAREAIENQVVARGGTGPLAVLWGVGNHGGGPSRKDLRDLSDKLASPDGAGFRHSTPEQFFDDLRAGNPHLPEHHAGLNPVMVGCYTSQVRIKQKHRRLENGLLTLEKMAAAADGFGLANYPKQEISRAWEDLLTAQFHDILPGTSTAPAEEASLELLDHGLMDVARLQTRAFFALAAGQPAAAPDTLPILVYNPHPFPVRTEIECELQLADQNYEDSFTFTPVYQNGSVVPCQNEKEESNIALDWRKRVAFLAELAPMQISRFDCVPQRVAARPKPPLVESGGHFTFEAGAVRIEINTTTGLIDHYSVNGIAQLAAGALQPVVLPDNADPWAMTVASFGPSDGVFELMDCGEATRFSGLDDPAVPAVRVIEDGALRTVVEVVLRYRDSRICQHYLLSKTGGGIEVRLRVFWQEKDRMLKLAIPLASACTGATRQDVFGVCPFPTDGAESVHQQWIALSHGDGQALTVINDGCHGADLLGGALRLSLLRSPAYSAHPIPERPIVPPGRFTPRSDQGERLFRFWLQGGPAAKLLAGIERESAIRNEKPIALSCFPSGEGTPRGAFCEVDAPAIRMSCLKRGEEGGIIVRLYETTGSARAATIRFPWCHAEHQLHFSPFEIQTIRFDPATGRFESIAPLESPAHA